jgi:CheY-like chemotaxis protein
VRVELALATARPGAVEPDPARLAIARRLALAERGAVSSAVAAGQLRLSATLPSPGRPTVMVVDDNPDVALVLRRHLESAGLEVVALDRGELAVERARELRPVAIALDVMMAGQDGWETLQQLKNHPQTHQIPVLICSVLREPELARFLGAAALLPKPLTRSDLLAALARLGVAVRPSVALPGD